MKKKKKIISKKKNVFKINEKKKKKELKKWKNKSMIVLYKEIYSQLLYKQFMEFLMHLNKNKKMVLISFFLFLMDKSMEELMAI